MQIERVETYPCLYKLPKPYGDANGYKKYRSCYLFKIVTTSGIEGWGEVIDWLPTLDKGFQERIIPYLLGKQVTDRSRLTRTVKKWHQRAATGVSMALTEIIAKQAGLNVCELWGGRWHDQVPVYASFQSYTDQVDWADYSVSLVTQAVKAGFTMAKVKIGGRTIHEDQQHIKQMQTQVGNSVKLAVDANQSYDVPATREWERIFCQWNNWMWLEEPMPLDRVQQYTFLRSYLSVPLAGGENLASTKAFLPLLTSSALDIIQPDPMHEDGIDGYVDTLRLARQFGMRVSPHDFDGGLTRLYSLFGQACLPPFSKMNGDEIEPAEWDCMENPFTRLLSIQPSQGNVAIPTGVGIGAEIDLELVKAHRWDGQTYT